MNIFQALRDVQVIFRINGQAAPGPVCEIFDIHLMAFDELIWLSVAVTGYFTTKKKSNGST
jgi:hypothetical protein